MIIKNNLKYGKQGNNNCNEKKCEYSLQMNLNGLKQIVFVVSNIESTICIVC
jgi:hypothetical protein